jgi:hypothetical protein
LTSQKLRRDIFSYNRHRIEPLLLLRLLIQKIVHLEMLDILRVRQILQRRALAMVFLKMMNLILIFVVAVVSRSPSEIRQRQSSADADCVFREGDGTAAVAVEVCNDAIDCGVLVCLWDVLCRFVVEAVCFVDVLVRPFTAVGKVM